MEFNQQKLIRVLRLSFTTIILFFITWYYNVPEGIWSIMTVWLVMYEYTTVGGVFKKSLYRAIGTFTSAVFSIIIIYFCHNNFFINVLIIIPAALFYAYLFMDGEKSYIATIGSATLAIVLFNYNRIDIAVIRVFNIMLGILITMLMMLFFYPQYARDQLLASQSKLVFLITEMIKDYLDTSLSLETLKAKYIKNEHKLLTELTNINRQLGEVEMEVLKIPLYITCNKSAYEHSRHLFHLISLFANYLSTEEIRSEPFVSSNFSLLLPRLGDIRTKLDNTGTQILSGMPILFKEANHKKSLDTKDDSFIRIIFESINAEVVLLDKDVNEIVSIYRNR